MHIEFHEKGGVLIMGDEDELRDLAGDIELAADDGETVAQMLTDEGVEQVTIRRAERAV
jgi:hypothetical protein